MTDDDKRPAVPPMREKSASLVEIESRVEAVITAQIEEVLNRKLDSLLPINEEQLEILKRADDERKKRALSDIARKEKQKKDDRFYKVLVLFIGLITTLVEAYRASHH